ncbi:MAG: hypothetical protein M3032_04845, partial [Verrucomicrobiota bacterium]|nr:hypothetical protein [Verrucomicrobiota bacterium]
MEQIFFVVLVGIVALLRFVMQRAEQKRNREAARRVSPTSQPNAPVPRAGAESEEERIRRFMEALGVPAPNAPPPKTPPPRVMPKTARPPKKILPVDPFPTPRVEVSREP